MKGDGGEEAGQEGRKGWREAERGGGRNTDALHFVVFGGQLVSE